MLITPHKKRNSLLQLYELWHSSLLEGYFLKAAGFLTPESAKKGNRS